MKSKNLDEEKKLFRDPLTRGTGGKRWGAKIHYGV